MTTTTCFMAQQDSNEEADDEDVEEEADDEDVEEEDEDDEGEEDEDESIAAALSAAAASLSAAAAASSAPMFSTASAEEINGRWTAANDFPTFLNQCAIQSFVFLLRSLRDPQTVFWIERFTKPIIRSKKTTAADTMASNDSNIAAETAAILEKSRQDVTVKGETSQLLRYHGIAAINTTIFPTWDSYYKQLLQQPEEIIVVESSRPHVPDYELDIKPASLCARLISVREQIAGEFVKDLDVLASLGGHTIESYWESIKKQKENDSDGAAKMERPNLLFLDFDVDFYDYKPSPLRKGNFDLLTMYATQESIHRVLNDGSKLVQLEEAKLSCKQFLHQFYQERLISHFTGSQWYNRADDFLEELLSQPPRMIQVREGVTHLVDPIKIAETILEAREEVALEWKEIAQNVGTDHMEIKKVQLNLLMGITPPAAAEDSTSTTPIEEESEQ